MGMKKLYVKNDNYLRSMMTLRSYVVAVIRCENTFIIAKQQMEDDAGIFQQFGRYRYSLKIKFSIAGFVHSQLFNAIAYIAIPNCSSTVQQQTQAVTSLRSISR
jgi:hypothetical protein